MTHIIYLVQHNNISGSKFLWKSKYFQIFRGNGKQLVDVHLENNRTTNFTSLVRLMPQCVYSLLILTQLGVTFIIR